MRIANPLYGMLKKTIGNDRGNMMSRPVAYAQDILTRLWDKSIPVNPEQIIGRISDIKLQSEPMSDDCSGMIEYDSKIGKYVISVNANHGQNRQRFTIAHELGHYALNHGDKKDTLFRHANGAHERDEIEANQFAAELLMPEGVIRHLIFNEKIVDVSILAGKLWVSEQAMLYRLKNLGLVS